MRCSVSLQVKDHIVLEAHLYVQEKRTVLHPDVEILNFIYGYDFEQRLNQTPQ